MQFLSNRTAECLQETYHRIVSDTEKNSLHNFITVPKNGFLIKEVKAYLNVNPMDLLVMGNKGRTGAKKIFLGGNPKELNMKLPQLTNVVQI